MAISSWLYRTRLYLLLGLCGLLGSVIGCQSSPSVDTISSSSSSQTPAIPKSPSAPPIVTQPKPITLSFNISSPKEDLKIKSGDFVRKGQMLADPSKNRLDLEARKRLLDSDLKALSQTGNVSFSTQAEEENIALAQTQLSSAQSLMSDYERNSPWTDFARDNLPLAEEEVELTQLKKNLKVAQNNLSVAKEKLAKKQVAIGNFQNEQSSAKTRLQQEILKVDQQILGLKPIQSSHTGTITKIDFAKIASSGDVKVTVTLLPGDAPTPQSLPGGVPPGLPQNSTQTSDPLNSDPLLNPESANDVLPLSPGIAENQPSPITPLPNSTVE